MLNGACAVFLDRDGTLIEGLGYLGDPTQVRAVSGAAEALEVLLSKGWRPVVVTNQSGVARGYFTESDYRAVERAVCEALPGIEASYACFHLEQGRVEPWNRACDCRKPLPGMLERAAVDLQLDLGTCVLVGDDLRDLQAARAAGVRPCLVRTGKGKGVESRLQDAGLSGTEVYDDVLAVARALAVAPESRS